MPIHEYACASCGNQFEKLLRRAADRDSLRCPSCNSAELNQQYSSFAAAVAGAKSPASQPEGCPAGMCATPGLCGRN